MSRHKVQKSSFGNNAVPKKSSSLNQANSWTNPYQQRNAKASEQPINTVKPPTTAEWLQDNVFLKAIETRKAQLQRQQLEENAGTEPQLESIQTKLTVGEPGDKFEPVADMMASRVMSMPDNAVQRLLAPEEQTEQEVQTKPANAITPLVQRAAMPATDGSSQAGGNIESRLNSSKGGGSPLSADVRGFMEPRFGADFSSVRVHTGSEAVQMSRELGAQAFTHGSNVYFGEGKAPGNNELTAHELTHVVQQGGGVQFQQGQNSQKHQDTKAAVVSLTSLVQQNVIAPRIQRWVLPTDWLDYIGLTVDAAERIYIELKYKEGQEKDFKRFVNNLFIAIDLVFAAAPGAGGGGLALRASHSGAVVAWAATPDSLKLKIAAEVAKRMGWPVTRALQMANIYFSATEGSGGEEENRPWKEDAYHGQKPEYENPGHHDPSSPNFRGQGSKTSKLPQDAEEVYKKAIPEKDGRTWWGRNSQGEYYRYQGSNGKVHWNGRQQSERGLKVPDYIKKRFEGLNQR